MKRHSQLLSKRNNDNYSPLTHDNVHFNPLHAREGNNQARRDELCKSVRQNSRFAKVHFRGLNFSSVIDSAGVQKKPCKRAFAFGESSASLREPHLHHSLKTD